MMKRGIFTAWVALVLILNGCASAAQNTDNARSNTALGTATIYVVSHGWHTGLVMPAGHPGKLDFLSDYFNVDPESGWYEIGWGDQEFYQAEAVTIGLTLRAGLLPTDSVLHVTALPQRPDIHFRNSRVIELHIDATGLAQLTTAIAAYFRRDENGMLLTQGKGLYGQSMFFAATGRFHAFNTCNTWTARMLDRAGLPIRTFMTLGADNVMNQLESIAVSDTGEP